MSAKVKGDVLGGDGVAAVSLTVVAGGSTRAPLVNPEAHAWFFPGKALFTWVTPLFTFARRKMKSSGLELEEDDMWDLQNKDATDELSRKFEEAWEKTGKKLGVVNGLPTSSQAQQMLMAGIWANIGTRMYIAGLLKLLNSTVQFSYPIILYFLLEKITKIALAYEIGLTGAAYDNYVGPISTAYALAAAFGISMLFKALLEGGYFWMTSRAGWQTRSLISTQVYRKSLRLSAAARQTRTLGEIVNLMQLDSTKMEAFYGMNFHVLWDGVYQVVGYMCILFYYIGWPAFVGLAFMVVAVPIQGKVFGKLMINNRKMVKVTDTRVKTTNEVLQGMLGIKMAGWETKYAQVIDESRSEELKFLRHTMYLSSFNTAYMSSMPALTAVVALNTYAVVNDGLITAATLFAALSAFSQLRFPLMFYPASLMALAQHKDSKRRVGEFLALEEVEGRASAGEQVSLDEARPVVSVSDGEFYWSRPGSALALSEQKKAEARRDMSKKDLKKQQMSVDLESAQAQPVVEERPVLSGINLNVKKGSLVAVIGPVGCGKSSLINSILSEMHRTNGQVQVHGSIAYAAQSAWIMNATIRDNILFGEPLDERRYQKTIKACQLLHDLEVLEAGDMTMIGERGINLSGGQKQRISVARAVYSSRDIVLLDDPLSALDPQVAVQMFNECFVKLLKGKTRILVTNQLQFLEQADSVVVLDAKPNAPGRIVEQGSYAELLVSGANFASLMEKFHAGVQQEGGEEKENKKSEPVDQDKERMEKALADALDSARPSSQLSQDSSAGQEGSKEDKEQGASAEKTKKQEAKALMQVEERSKGAVKLDYYLGYARSGGGIPFTLFVLFMFLLAQCSMLLTTYWITFWTEDLTYANHSFQFYLWGYAITVFLLAGLTFVRTLLLYYLGLTASRNLHKGLVESVLHAPMSYFDTTPIGRIVSRFSTDLYMVDTQLNMRFSFFFFTVSFVVFSLCSVAYTTPLFLVAIPFLGVAYFYMLSIYRPLARDSKRIESISRSPIFAHFSETLGGLVTIRSFSSANAFAAENSRKVDNNIRSSLVLKAIERWLAVRLEIMGAFIAVIAASLSVYAATQGQLSAGLAGFSLSFASGVTNLLNQTVRTFADLEAGMNSVERLLHYTNHIEQEAAFESKNPPPKDWPARGEIKLNELAMRYRKDTKLVLKGVSAHIQAGWRVGVVGRTGSGKSSMLLCLLRLVEPYEEPGKPHQAQISIDGIDISTIGLHELRQKLSIVQQSPTLFSGTVRSNLDPFNQFGDERIWDALDKCELRQAITEIGGLDGAVSEYGENFSQGQRQLLTLARSVLKQSRILLLDEATSSLDYGSDAAVQRTLRTAFPDVTMITIAHRLNTIIASDFLIVLDDGKVAESGHPAELLDNEAGIFSAMVRGMGEKQASSLKQQSMRHLAQKKASQSNAI